MSHQHIDKSKEKQCRGCRAKQREIEKLKKRITELENEIETLNEEQSSNDENESKRICIDLEEVITKQAVYNQSDDISIERSEEYMDCIYSATVDNDEYNISASVNDYFVTISVVIDPKTNKPRLTGDCSCPSFRHWCKHLVAVGIKYAQDPKNFENDDY